MLFRSRKILESGQQQPANKSQLPGEPLKCLFKNVRHVDFDYSQSAYIMMEEYGITNAKSKQPILGSDRAYTCAILALHDRKNKLAVLAHIPPDADIECINLLFENRLKELSMRDTVAYYFGGSIKYKIESPHPKVVKLLEAKRISEIKIDLWRATNSNRASFAIDARTGNIYSPVEEAQLGYTGNLEQRFKNVDCDTPAPLKLAYDYRWPPQIIARKDAVTTLQFI